MRLFAALLLCALVVLPSVVPADSLDYVPVPTDAASLQETARALGCADVQVQEGWSPWMGLNAYFMVTYDGQPIIRLINMHGVPPGIRLMIFLHETGHCLQWHEGSIFRMHSVERELDADLRAALLACQMGLRGDRLLHDLFVWANSQFGYEGDPDHGTLAQRIEQGTRLRGLCARPHESP